MNDNIESSPDISGQKDESTAADQITEESGDLGLDPSSIAVQKPETEEQSAVEQSTSDEVASETTTEVTTNTDAGRSLTFQRLVQNWESYVNNGTRNVHIGLQNLSLCGVGEGLARIGPSPSRRLDGDDDPFAPIVLRHTHSSPLQYSASLVDEGEILPPPSGLDQVRRSSSTPSTSVFRQRSAGSAFGAHLRAMPRLSDCEDRIGSAFSLPMHRSSYASVSDSGVRYSAFDPIAFPGIDDIIEKTTIEVTDLGPRLEREDVAKSQTLRATPAKWGAARRARTFLSDNRVLQFRNRRSGRENPARPPSSSSSSKSDESKQKDAGDNDTISTKSSANTKEYRSDKTDRKPAAKRKSKPPKSAFPLTILESTKISGNKEPSEYHQLESEFDEDYEHYQGIETSIGHSPQTVPSPSYHHFVDDHVASETTETTDVVGGANLSSVRIDVSTITSPPRTPGNNGYSICRPHLEGCNATTLSQGSEPQSPGTNNTSGHATQSTSTSATTSSGRITLLSPVSETDREVMETNKAGKIMRLQQQNPTRTDGESSVHSASTTSTNTYGYLALTGSPAPLRDGASLPVDRFFTHSRIPVAHSCSSHSGGSSSSGSGGAPCVHPSGSTIAPADASQASSSIPSKKSSSSPHTDSSVSAANTASSSSNGEEPPKFVSYLDRQGIESTKLSRDGLMSTMSSQDTPERVGNENEDRESPAHIVGYLDVVIEEAQSQSTNLIRPVQQRDPKFASRPPLSPVKGLRAPDTPPPSSTYGRPESYSPAYQQMSPPTIVDRRVHPGQSNLSKPYVFRSAPPLASSDSHVLASPEMLTNSKTFAISPDMTAESESYIYSIGGLEGGIESFDSHRNRTCIEASIEVEKSDETTTHVPVVSPDKGST